MSVSAFGEFYTWLRKAHAEKTAPIRTFELHSNRRGYTLIVVMNDGRSARIKEATGLTAHDYRRRLPL